MAIATEHPVQLGPMKLNLGCSDSLEPEFLNVDIFVPRLEPALLWVEGEDWPGRFARDDLRGTWRWPDSSVDAIRAHDIFEHLPSKIHTMNEAHRVLKPGGTLDLVIPTTDGRGAFQDPTHVTFWTPNDLFYFCDHYAEWIRFHESYGIKARFRVANAVGAGVANALIEMGHQEYGDKVWKLRIELEAVK